MNLLEKIFPILRKKEGCSDGWGSVDSRNIKEKIKDYFKSILNANHDEGEVKRGKTSSGKIKRRKTTSRRIMR